MRAPSKVRNNQLVKIQPIQRLTTGIEPTTALQEVTNVMKPVEGTYQATSLYSEHLIEEPCVGKLLAGFCGGCHSNKTTLNLNME